MKISPDNADALYLGALCRHAQGQHGDGARLMSAAVAKGLADHPEPLNNAGQVLKAGGRLDEAVQVYRRALRLAPNEPSIHVNLGNALAGLDDQEGAITAYETAIRLNPGTVAAYVNLAGLLKDLERYPEAENCLERVLVIAPGHPDALATLSGLLIELGRLGEGYEAALQVLSADPDHMLANANAGVCLTLQGMHADAVPHLTKATQGNAPDRTALLYLGIAHTADKSFAEGFQALSRACTLYPDFGPAVAALYLNQQSQSRWDGMQDLSARLDALNARALDRGIAVPERAIHNVGRHIDPEENLRIARSHADHAARLAALSGRRYDHSPRGDGRAKIRLGYLSGDFRNHPVAHSIRRLLELHDRDRFEVHAYSSGPDDGSTYRRHFEATADRFVDIREMNDGNAADRIFEDEIDILIDLSGHTTDNRLQVAALRPAPVQILWFGYPGTVGGSFFDYIVVDETIVPPAHRGHYAETAVDMPHCFMMLDDAVEIADTPITRADEGLAEGAFVFASFCEPRKYEPETFDVWMDLLSAVPGSVLWLLARDAETQGNLIAEGAKRGVAADRFVFAGFRPKAEHMARLGLADLALDTWTYNGHVTTADYLLAGLPLVAMAGGHFASRVSASLLGAAGLGDLVAPDVAGYRQRAMDLAQDPDSLTAVRRRLAEARETSRLFDTSRFVRDLEKIYTQVWESR